METDGAADERVFDDVAAGRRQAEAWRNGVAGVTALLGAAVIVRGRDDVTDLVWWLQWWIALLLVVAFVALIRAVFLAARAAGGEPGDRAGLGLGSARRWTVAGLSLIVMALLVGWLSPVAETTRPLMKVDHEGGTDCGPVSFEHDGYVVVTAPYVVSPGSVVAAENWIPLGQVRRLVEVPSCT
ncbi:hypothetical protein AB0H43_12120 [Hamadaea sp. NPDC050747]|uniref:hypothetical protein n=1 Tax=Hamadaea sp. NPDC050747 TaxID=3155789 RepID=UPI0033D6B4CE